MGTLRAEGHTSTDGDFLQNNGRSHGGTVDCALGRGAPPESRAPSTDADYAVLSFARVSSLKWPVAGILFAFCHDLSASAVALFQVPFTVPL